MLNSMGRTKSEKANTYHHGNLRSALISASVGIIESQGINALSLRKAARAAGVSHAAPAHHFRDMKGLLAAIAEEGYLKMLGQMEQKSGKVEDPLAKLKAIGIAFVEFSASKPSYFEVMHHPMLSNKATHPTLLEASTKTFELLTETIKSCQQGGTVRNGDPRNLALLAWSTLHGLSSLAVNGQLASKGFAAEVRKLAETVTSEMYLGLRSDN